LTDDLSAANNVGTDAFWRSRALLFEVTDLQRHFYGVSALAGAFLVITILESSRFLGDMLPLLDGAKWPRSGKSPLPWS